MAILPRLSATVMFCSCLTPAVLSAAGGGAASYLKKPDSWFSSDESQRVAANILSWQSESGGWPKNTETADLPHTGDRAEIHPTFDNGATTDELRFLARRFNVTHDETDLTAFAKGLSYILKAQYPSGGWPQFDPPGKNYHRHITFNDGAMVRLLQFLREVHRTEGYRFVPDGDQQAAGVAFEKGIDCILRCQIRVEGKPTVWCAQHDEINYLPRPARAFELASFSGSESVGITRLLMSLEKPGPEVRAAIEGAVAWFESAKLAGIRLEKQPDTTAAEGTHLIVITDPAAPPLWARFYDLNTGKPFFCDRDGIPKSTLAEIGTERRNGYAWYGDWPKTLLENEYPEWRKRWEVATADDVSEALSPFQAEASADLVVTFDMDGKLDIGIGRADERNGFWNSMTFKPDELKEFFDRQKHEDHLLVIISKNNWPETKRTAEAETLRVYFSERGFKRISIQQATGGLVRPQLLDYRTGEGAQ